MFDVGSIVINKDIVFSNSNKLDHAYKGRPCLVIALNDDYFYYLTISSKSSCLREKYSFYNKKRKKTNYIKISTIYRTPMVFKKEHDKINQEELLNLYKVFIEYYKENEKCEYYDEVIQYINAYISKYENQKSKQYTIKY